MTFPFSYYLVAIASSLAVSALALPFWRGVCLRHQLVDDPGHRKIHDAPIPLAGGLAVMTGIVVPLVFGSLAAWALRSAHGQPQSGGGGAGEMDSIYLLNYGLRRRFIELAGIVIGAIGMLFLGLLDDKHELRAGAKFSGQVLIALFVASCGVRISLFVPNIAFHYGITVLWILMVINAFNFMDNMNGLCAGLGAISAFYFGVIGAVAGQYLVALIAFLSGGALLGFLPHNFPRAKAFLGDSGSHLVGYLLAVLAILPHFYSSKHPHRWAVLIPMFVLALPLLDMAWVVLLRTIKRQPFWVGDTNHLSHRLVRLGLTQVQAVILIWLLAVSFGSLAFLF